MVTFLESMRYSEPATDAGSPATGIYSNAAAASLAAVLSLVSPETNHDHLLARLEQTDNAVLVRFRGESPDRPLRATLEAHFSAATAADKLAHEDVYGVRMYTLGERSLLKLEKLCTIDWTSGAVAVGGGSGGGGREAGTQVLAKAVTVTSTGVLEAHTNGSVAPRGYSDGANVGVAIADIGPYRALLRLPYLGVTTPAAGVSLLHGRWL